MNKNPMPTIIKFSYEHLRNETHVAFHTNFNALVAQFGAEALGIQALYAIYKPLYDDELTALDAILKSRFTAVIKSLDRERNMLCRGFGRQVKSYFLHFDPARRKAAQRLDIIVKHYGGIAYKPLNDKTAAITDLYSELQKPENAEAVTALGLGEWLEKLADANRRLAEMMRNRFDEAAKRPDIHMRSVRQQVDRLFREILRQLEALVCIQGEGANRAFLAELNVMAGDYKLALAQEAGRRHPVKDLGAGGHTVITLAKTYPYTGKPITPIPTVYYHSEGKPSAELVFAEDFTLTYRNNIHDGMADVIVHGKGNYKGKNMATFNIVKGEE
ncbi:MAG: DUF6261 family protein [Prevotellaceae bacterium]|jgi:hypothetical protein|nr:DUF6261 family protein [Prevotellaceae bacterium]